MPQPNPYLSVVATARNDNHGGDLLRRIQIFVNALAAQCERFDLPAELVLVEWNPPADEPRLADVIRWPEVDARLAVRIVEVPNERHLRFAHAERLSLFQMIAKNAGIRRARAPFVLATNVDVLLDDELVGTLAARRLRPGTVYRADRHDTDAVLDPSTPVFEQLRACADAVVRICRLEGTDDLHTGEYFQIYGPLTKLPGPFARWSRAVSLGLPLGLHLATSALRRATSRSLGAVRFARNLVRRAEAVSRHATAAEGSSVWTIASRLTASSAGRRRLLRVAAAIVREERAERRARIALLEHGPGASSAQAGLLRRYRAFKRDVAALWLHEKARVRVHSNACGDFTLLAAEDWARLRGYAELEMFSMHLDSLLLYEAHYSGLREKVLPGAVYHLEHGGGFKPDELSRRSLNDRIERALVPQISNEQFMEWILDMHRRKSPMRLNTRTWGLAGEGLREVDPAQLPRPSEALR